MSESTVEKFTFLAKELVPQHEELQSLPSYIHRAPEEKQALLIDTYFFGVGEYLGGMATVLLAMCERAK